MAQIFDTTGSIPSLNKRLSRGKWYVSLRGSPLTVVRGFVGSKDDLDAFIQENLQSIIEEIRSFDSRLLGDPDRWRLESAKILFKAASNRSSRRGYDLDITVDWIASRLEKIGDRCEVSGLGFVYAASEKLWHRNPRGPSIDRINGKGGYTTSNVRLVCTSVNVAINEWGEEAFYQMCAAVQNKQKIVVQSEGISI